MADVWGRGLELEGRYSRTLLVHWGLPRLSLKGLEAYPPPPCKSYALVQATAGVGTVLNWDPNLIRYKCSAAT